MKNDIDNARRIVAELESKLAAASDRATALASERRRLAYDAGVGDAKAKTKLEKLTNESAIAAVDVENCRAALEQGRHQLASAEHVAAIAERKANAEHLQRAAKGLADKIQARGPAMSAALVTFCEEYSALEADLQSLRDLGSEIVPSRNVRLAFEAVVSHTLRGAGLRVGNLVEPGRRHTATEMTTGYAERANAWAADGALNDKAAA